MERLTERNGKQILGKYGVAIFEALECLAAYEDTGLSPAEVAEIAEAKKDGRLVVLPCKVGEYWERDGKRYIVAEIAMTNAWGVMVRHYEEGDGKMLSCNPQYFAKHYTREEAEEALRKEQER